MSSPCGSSKNKKKKKNNTQKNITYRNAEKQKSTTKHKKEHTIRKLEKG